MNNLYREATKSTPEINFDSDSRVLTLKGVSYPENAQEFYQPVYEWLIDFLKQIKDKAVKFEIEFVYMNTSSTKSLISILNILEKAHQQGVDVDLYWYYDKENELAYELAEDFMEDMELPFHLVMKDDEAS